jgi:hypothetical protein
MIAELKSYADSHPSPPDRDAILDCAAYLESIHQLFKLGAISEDKIRSIYSSPMQNMVAGLAFLKTWYQKVHQTNNFCSAYEKMRAFLSSDTFDAVRFVVYGFKMLVANFFAKFPNDYLIPKRLTGSPVESIFSSLRYYSAGQLTSINYDCTLLRLSNMQQTHLQNVKRKSQHGDDAEYRNQQISFKKVRKN